MKRPEWRRRHRAWHIGAVAWALCGCAATNYLEPSGPLYTGAFAGVGTPAGALPDTLGAADAVRPVSPTTPEPLPAGAIRVVSFNIAYAVEIDSALAVLRHEAAVGQPDILCLQEMDAPGTERIAAALRLNYVYFPSGVHPKYDRDFGCAILSPWPLREPRKIVLPHPARLTGLRRAVTVVTLCRGEQRLRVYSVHLPSPAGISGAQRRQQVDVLIADALASADPVILAGDWNSEDLGEAFVRAGFVWPTSGILPTTRAYGVGFRYDHVFARRLRLAPGDATAGVVMRNRQASDHYPIWVLLTPE